mmetsp:Transcript_18965/g.48522  ORF Transcript_18965/g.48522 Transcript_18965/m.48522 type:complete len:128 (+) Transcript_18965:351-734(+)
MLAHARARIATHPSLSRDSSPINHPRDHSLSATRHNIPHQSGNAMVSQFPHGRLRSSARRLWPWACVRQQSALRTDPILPSPVHAAASATLQARAGRSRPPLTPSLTQQSPPPKTPPPPCPSTCHSP